MEQYRITVTTPDEAHRANVDGTHAPAEFAVADFTAESRHAAERKFSRMRREHPEWYQPQLIDVI